MQLMQQVFKFVSLLFSESLKISRIECCM